MAETIDWGVKVPSLARLAYFGRVSGRVFSRERCSELGSLIDPERDVKAFVDEDLHKDPPEFRAWLAAEFMRWMDLRAEHESKEGWAGVARRYLLGELRQDREEG